MIIHDTENVGNIDIFNSVSCIIISAQMLSHTRCHSWAAFRNVTQIRYNYFILVYPYLMNDKDSLTLQRSRMMFLNAWDCLDQQANYINQYYISQLPLVRRSYAMHIDTCTLNAATFTARRDSQSLFRSYGKVVNWLAITSHLAAR